MEELEYCSFDDCKKIVKGKWWCNDCDDKARASRSQWEYAGCPNYPGAMPCTVQYYNEQLKKSQPKPQEATMATCLFDDCKKEHDNIYWCDDCCVKQRDARDKWIADGRPSYPRVDFLVMEIYHYNEQLKKSQPKPQEKSGYMKTQITITLDRAQVNEILRDHILKTNPHLKLDELPRFWTEMLTVGGYTLVDDPKCPETFEFHFASAPDTTSTPSE